MGVCEAYRIPHSTFLSWSPDDRDKAIWYRVRERERCGQCGTRPDEWGPDGRRLAYVADIRRCRGCEELERASESPEAKDGRGKHVVLRRP